MLLPMISVTLQSTDNPRFYCHGPRGYLYLCTRCTTEMQLFYLRIVIKDIMFQSTTALQRELGGGCCAYLPRWTCIQITRATAVTVHKLKNGNSLWQLEFLLPVLCQYSKTHQLFVYKCTFLNQLTVHVTENISCNT